MEKFTKSFSDSEVKNRYVLLPKGKEKIFPRKDDFEITFSGRSFKAFLLPEESKSMGKNMRIFQYKLMFREPQPSIFEFGKIITLTQTGDSSWEVTLK